MYSQSGAQGHFDSFSAVWPRHLDCRYGHTVCYASGRRKELKLCKLRLIVTNRRCNLKTRRKYRDFSSAPSDAPGSLEVKEKRIIEGLLRCFFRYFQVPARGETIAGFEQAWAQQFHVITRAFQRKRSSCNSGVVFFLFSFGRKSQSSPHHVCEAF